ncbi:hypothetical protein T492DRAFT_1018412 [Pavlovales sp. CCMP2436]|nr:hypothetical protein T492DRAFT_1018412 [Pavlovales sp. CCMP2436]
MIIVTSGLLVLVHRRRRPGTAVLWLAESPPAAISNGRSLSRASPLFAFGVRRRL